MGMRRRALLQPTLRPSPPTFIAAIALASEAARLGFKTPEVRSSSSWGSASRYVRFWFQRRAIVIRVSDHANPVSTCDFDVADIADLAPAKARLSDLRRGSVR